MLSQTVVEDLNKPPSLKTVGRADECCLVLNQTPLFMFVKPLAVLLSNVLVCFSVF